MPRTLPHRPLLLAALALAAAACADPAVNWQDERTQPAADGAVALTPDGTLAADAMAAVAAAASSPSGPVCWGSLRVSQASGTTYGVWWAPRPDSGARLMSARSTDGGRTWGAPAPVDTTDVGVSGCRREPAAIAADSVSGYVHVTYALQAKEGPGLFFSHSMDGGASFHEPVPILYGERLGRTSVAADGDVVVVGFEDPNGKQPRIGLALSRTMGHIFEQRVLPLSDENGGAARPYTAVRGRRVAVAWERSADRGSTPVMVLRTGTLP